MISTIFEKTFLEPLTFSLLTTRPSSIAKTGDMSSTFAIKAETSFVTRL